MATPTSTLRLTLLENGLDSLLHAVEHLRGDPKPRDVKQGLLNLADGVELLLKERLRRYDWQLLFEDVAQANEHDLASGDFYSATAETTIRRLRHKAGVRVSAGAHKRMRALRFERNRIRHFAADHSVTSVLARAARVLAFAVDFVARELEPVEGTAAGDLAEIRQALSDYSAFVEARWEEIRPALANAEAVIDCPRCLEHAAVLDDGVSCFFCGFANEAEEGAAEYAASVLGLSYYETVKEGGDWAVSTCPNCARTTLVDEGISGDATPQRRWICFGCGSSWHEGSMESCGRCGGWFPSGNGMSVCDDCFEYVVSGSD